MTTARLRFIALACLFLCAPHLRADELLLNSGKTIRGRITSEDDESYRIKVRANMALRISKSDVARVTRDPSSDAPKAVRPPSRKAAAAKPAPKPAPAAPAPAEETAPPTPPAPRTTESAEAASSEPAPPVTLSPEVPGVSHRIGAVTLNQSSVKAFYSVKDASYEAAMKTITDPARGKGFLIRGARRPSRTQWRLGWYGKSANGGTSWESLVVNSTITATLPTWSPRRRAASGETARWDAMSKECVDVENGHIRIIEEALETFATEASNLTAPNEEELRIQTGKLLTDARVRSDKRRKGYDRRRAEIKLKRLNRKKVVR